MGVLFWPYFSDPILEIVHLHAYMDLLFWSCFAAHLGAHLETPVLWLLRWPNIKMRMASQLLQGTVDSREESEFKTG